VRRRTATSSAGPAAARTVAAPRAIRARPGRKRGAPPRGRHAEGAAARAAQDGRSTRKLDWMRRVLSPFYVVTLTLVSHVDGAASASLSLWKRPTGPKSGFRSVRIALSPTKVGLPALA